MQCQNSRCVCTGLCVFGGKNKCQHETHGLFFHPDKRCYANDDKPCYANEYETVSVAPGARSGTFSSTGTQTCYANPYYRPSSDNQVCPGRYSVRTDKANCYARLAVHQDGPRRTFVGQGNRLYTHACTHDPRLKQIAGRIVRKYDFNRANVTSTGRTAVLTHNVFSTAQNTADAIVGTVNTLAVGTATSRPLPRGPVGPGAEVTSASPRVVSTLQRHLPAWRALGPGEWIMRSITHGYRLLFSTKPPLTRTLIPTVASGPALVSLREEIQALLSKGAIQKVDLEKSPVGFYSKYFLVKKKGGTMRPILDLKGLNRYLRKIKFSMLTTTSLLGRIRRGTWFTSVLFFLCSVGAAADCSRRAVLFSSRFRHHGCRRV